MGKILLLSDEPASRGLLSSTLRYVSCHQVLEAQDGTQAMELAARERPDLVLLDGLEMCGRLKTMPEMKGVPIVVLATPGHHWQKESSLRSGADAFFVKPFSPTELIGKIEALLESRCTELANTNELLQTK